MTRYKAVVSYDGTNYVGWQLQTNGTGIQEVIEKALAKVTTHAITIQGAGRTDGNVHAYGQVFHFDSEFELEESHWEKAINSYLPKDIHIRSVKKVKSSFHARYHVLSKRYDYLVNIQEFDVFKARYSYFCFYKLDLEIMRKAATLFVGEHDFTSFCANTKEQTTNQVRTITRLEIVEEKDYLRLIFEGKGFLRYMVRMISGTLIELGRGKINIDQVQEMLESKDKMACHFNAQAQGLYLVEINYREGVE